jgi:hypothetical protein
MPIELGPANHHAALCISRVRWLSQSVRYLLRKEGIWEDLIQELYATAFEAWQSGLDDIETRRFAGRRLYAFLKAYGFCVYRRGYFKRERPFASVFNYNIADRGIFPRDARPTPFICRGDDHLDEKVLALLRKHPEGLPRRKVSSSFQIPVWELNSYLNRLIKRKQVIAVKRENTRGRPLSPLLLIAGTEIQEGKMVKTERDERIRQAYLDGWSIKRINRELHHDKRIIRRAIRAASTI